MMQPNPVMLHAMSEAQRYMIMAQKYLPAVNERNPYLRQQVGSTIFDFVVQLVGPERAPKITGMLIELPVQQIKQFMSSYEALQHKVQAALDYLI